MSSQRDFHDFAHAHLVDAAHVEDVEILFMNEAPLAGVHAAYAHLAHPLGLIAGEAPPICSSSRGPKPQRQDTGIPCKLPVGTVRGY